MDELKSYLDKCFINAILCQYHYEYYNKINYICMFPLIIGSSILTILNSSTIPDNYLKYLNISINGLNTIIISLSNNYKLNDRISSYKNLYEKFNKLSHKFEKLILLNSNLTDDLINEYDNLQNDIIFGFLKSYKIKIINKYGKTRKMPNSLQLDGDLVLLEVLNA